MFSPANNGCATMVGAHFPEIVMGNSKVSRDLMDNCSLRAIASYLQRLSFRDEVPERPLDGGSRLPECGASECGRALVVRSARQSIGAASAGHCRLERTLSRRH